MKTRVKKQGRRMWKRNTLRLLVMLSVIAVLLLVVIAGTLGWLFLQKRSTPQKTLTEYVKLLNEKEYREM